MTKVRCAVRVIAGDRGASPTIDLLVLGLQIDLVSRRHVIGHNRAVDVDDTLSQCFFNIPPASIYAENFMCGTVGVRFRRHLRNATAHRSLRVSFLSPVLTFRTGGMPRKDMTSFILQNGSGKVHIVVHCEYEKPWALRPPDRLGQIESKSRYHGWVGWFRFRPRWVPKACPNGTRNKMSTMSWRRSNSADSS